VSLTAERIGSALRASTVLLAFALLAGCRGGNDTTAMPTTTSAPPLPTTTTVGEDRVAADIVDRYKQFWEVRFEANREPVNPDDARLSEYATGPQLENVIRETRQRRDQGVAIRRPERSVYERRVKVVRVEHDTAALQDCVTNDGIVYRVTTGEVVDPESVRDHAPRRRQVEARRDAGPPGVGGGGGMCSISGLLTAAALVFLLAGTHLPQAAADDEGGAGGTANAYVDGGGKPTALAREGRKSRGRRPSRSASASNCHWRTVNADDTVFAMYDVDGTRLHSATGRWRERWCDGEQVLVNGAYAVPERPRSVDPAALAREARQSVAIPPPPISTSPRADRELYTRVRTWLWVDRSWWRGYSATADAGGVSTTVSATPVRAVWSMGDGGQTVCEGPGVAWRQGMAEDATYCSYVYKNSSGGQPGGTYTMSVTVEFDVAWRSTIGAGGRLARIERSASRTVRVGEIQAVETA
jgi:hypothetical protein